MTLEGGIRVEEVALCLFCQQAGTQLYAGLRDRLFGTPGLWGFLRCSQCGLVWLNPRPCAEDLHRVYATYYTHVQDRKPSRLASWREKTKRALYGAVSGHPTLVNGWGWRLFGSALSLMPPLKEIGRLGTMGLDGSRKGRLLDVGCGDGRFLALMRDAGWEVLGVENDPHAAEVARGCFGVPVIAPTLEEACLSDGSVDVITLNHVIEHVFDPVGLLSKCNRLLRTDGRLVVVTPNNQSLGSRQFGQSWVHLDPPRHLILLSSRALRTLAARSGLTCATVRSSERNAQWTWAASCAIRDNGKFSDSDLDWQARLSGMVFQFREAVARRGKKGNGEELVLVASKSA